MSITVITVLQYYNKIRHQNKMNQMIKAKVFLFIFHVNLFHFKGKICTFKNAKEGALFRFLTFLENYANPQVLKNSTNFSTKRLNRARDTIDSYLKCVM